MIALVLDYDFNMPPDDDGLYRVLSHPLVREYQEPGDLVVFGDDDCRADGIVIGWERGYQGVPLLVIERRGEVRCS